MRIIAIAAAAAILSGCGNSAPEEDQADTPAAALESGEYQLTWSEVERKSAGSKAEGAPQSVESASFAERTCVAGGRIDPAGFAQKGDTCHTVQSYVRNGIVNVQLSCERKGDGKLSSMVTGKFTADSLDVEVETTTNFGKADSTTTRKVTAKRVGECPATAGSENGGEARES